MDDYLIGIRLALDNGVSAGLTAIRADLAILDRAVSNSAEGLRALSTMAPQPPPPGPAKAAQPVGRTSEAPSAASAAAPATPSEPSPRAAPIIRIDPPQSTPAQPVRWVSEAQPTTSVARTPTAAHLPATAPAISATSANPIAPNPSAPKSPGFANSPASTRQAPAVPLGDVSPAPLAAQPLPESSLAPMASPSQSAAQPTSFAPPSPSPSAQPTGGDVFLDGDRVGHWLANHLAREANRPSAGGTGFDPSLGITWPGALQGGQ